MKKIETAQEFAHICGFNVLNRNDEKRLAKCYAYYLKLYATNPDGALGCASEPLCRKHGSKIETVAPKNKKDGYFTLDGKRTYYEKKTGGGRITNKTAEYVVYMAYTHRSNCDFECEPRILKWDTLIAKLESIGGIRPVRNGKYDHTMGSIQIDITKAEFRRWMLEQLEYHAEWEYYTEDFE